MNDLSLFEKNIYNTYLKVTRDTKGYNPRKNFNNLDDAKYVVLKKISKILKNKKIDPVLFFKAPYSMYTERFVPLDYYGTFKAISTYKKYTKELELTKPDDQFNITRLRNSLKFVYEKCSVNNLTTCKDYLNLQSGIYPDFILDIQKGHVSYYCLLALEISETKIKLEKDLVEFACNSFYNTLSSLRSRYTFSKKIKPLGIKLTNTIDKILKKK